MRKFNLKSAVINGASHGPCLISIQEEAQSAEISRVGKGFLREKKTILARFSYDAKTSLTLEGERMHVGEIEMQAMSDQDALEIAAILDSPRAETADGKEGILEEAEASLLGLVRERGEALLLLKRWREAPAATALELAASVPESEADPVKLVLARHAEAMSEEMRKLESSLRVVSEKLGGEVAERVCALAFALGTLQDGALDASQADGGRKLLAELGFTGEASAQPEEVLSALHGSMMALVEGGS